MDAASYLKRVGYRGTGAPTIETLRALHLAHLLAVPFENVDITLGRPLSLESDALYDKIVTRRRGGFCFELNGLFAELLRTLGFNVTLLAADVAREDGSGWTRPDGHLALAVELEEPWLVDVGFGRDSFREPLRLRSSTAQVRHGVSYRIVPAGALHVLQIRRDGAWVDMYRFDLEPHELGDFEEACLYHQTSPQSPFSSRRFCALARLNGRVTLADRRLRRVEGTAMEEHQIEDDEALATALREHFGIVP